MAKPRAFSLKQTYVNKIVESLLRQEEESESIFKDLSILRKETIEEYVKNKFSNYL